MVDSQVVILIPARKGSVAVRMKNFRKIGGRSLVERTLQHAQSYSSFGPVVLSSDHHAFLDKLTQAEKASSTEGDLKLLNNGYLHYRSEALSTSESPIMDTVAEVVSRIEAETQLFVRGALLLQPTSPFRNMDDVKKITTLLKKANQDTSFVSFTNVGEYHPARMYLEAAKGQHFMSLGGFTGLEQTRRQDLPKVFIRDGAFYFIGRQLIEKREQVATQPLGIERHYPWSINIDTESDWILAKHVVKSINQDALEEN